MFNTERKISEQEFKCNWLYRELPQHDNDICSIEIDYGKTICNVVHSFFICYNSNRDSGGGKNLFTENAVPIDLENVTSTDNSLIEVDRVELLIEGNADSAGPC